MSLPKQRGQTSFFDIPFLLDDDFFQRDEPYALFRERVLPALRRAQSELDSLYCEDNGRPAVDPVIVAGATITHFASPLSASRTSLAAALPAIPSTSASAASASPVRIITGYLPQL